MNNITRNLYLDFCSQYYYKNANYILRCYIGSKDYHISHKPHSYSIDKQIIDDHINFLERYIVDKGIIK